MLLTMLAQWFTFSLSQVCYEYINGRLSRSRHFLHQDGPQRVVHWVEIRLKQSATILKRTVRCGGFSSGSWPRWFWHFVRWRPVASSQCRRARTRPLSRLESNFGRRFLLRRFSAGLSWAAADDSGYGVARPWKSSR